MKRLRVQTKRLGFKIVEVVTLESNVNLEMPPHLRLAISSPWYSDDAHPDAVDESHCPQRAATPSHSVAIKFNGVTTRRLFKTELRAASQACTIRLH
eukprot:2918420-Rhodomonas_salina.2